jgi:ABC-type histidine transport system ATPase subunit
VTLSGSSNLFGIHSGGVAPGYYLWPLRGHKQRSRSDHSELAIRGGAAEPQPTSALDPKRSAGLRSLLRGFVTRGHTMVIVSHSINFLEGLADQLLYMEGGEVVEYGETETVLNSPQDPRTKDFLQQAK